MDYREALGIGFCNEEKNTAFINSVLNYLENHPKTPYARETYLLFCNSVGIRANAEELTVNIKKIARQPKGFQIVLAHFEYVKNRFKEFLVYCVAFLNTYKDDNEEHEKLENFFTSSITRHKLDLIPIRDDDGIFFFPRGAKELDSALVSAPLEWLKDYPNTRETYSRALKQYSEMEHTRDVADNLRKTLEDFMKEFLHNEKDFDNNRSEICKYLKEKGADNNITNMLGPMLTSYKKNNDDRVKHNDKLDPKFLEFILYQTGLFIRMIITVGKED